MVYKKYIYKKGKKIGPYYYDSIRDENGKVRTIYIGRDPEEYLRQLKRKVPKQILVEKYKPLPKELPPRITTPKSFYPVLLIVLLVVGIGAFTLVFGQQAITGFLVAGPDWGQDFENYLEFNADSSMDEINAQIFFDEYKPVNCEDSIVVMGVKDGTEYIVPFEIIGGVYVEEVCSEAKIEFSNIGYEEAGVNYYIYYGEKIPGAKEDLESLLPVYEIPMPEEVPEAGEIALEEVPEVVPEVPEIVPEAPEVVPAAPEEAVPAARAPPTLSFKDSEDFELYTRLKFYEEGELVEEAIGEGTYDLEVVSNQYPVDKIEFRDLRITGDIVEIGLDDVPEDIAGPAGIELEEVYAIDPTQVEFTDATITATARATELYKCKDWDFDTRTCYGTWEKIKDLVPGQEYTLEITKEDPGFAEGGAKKDKNVSFGRNLDCDKCGRHKAPESTPVNMTISVTTKSAIPNATLTDYFENDWWVYNLNGGNTSPYNATHDKISWYVGTVDPYVEKWYMIYAPSVSYPSEKYYFQTEIDGTISDPWLVIVADATLSTVLIAPTTDPNIVIGGSFEMNCSAQAGGITNNVYLHAEYDNCTGEASWYDIPTTNGLNTSDTNPVFHSGKLSNNAYVYGNWLVYGQKPCYPYKIRCRAHSDEVAESLSPVYNVTVSQTYCNGNYAGGNWVVSGGEFITCADEWINLTGNLTIGGNLTFGNISLQVDTYSAWDRNVLVTAGGVFNVTNGSTLNSSNQFYDVNASSGSVLEIYDSRVEDSTININTTNNCTLKNTSVSNVGFAGQNVINLWEEGSGNTFENITVDSGGGTGINFYFSDNNTVNNSLLLDKIYLLNSNGNNISYVNASTGVGSSALTFYNSNNSYVIESNFTGTAGGVGVSSLDSFYNLIGNSTVNGSNIDIWMDLEGNLTVLNTSFNKDGVTFNIIATTNTLYVEWYLWVYVNDTGGSPVSGADVNVSNVTNGLQWRSDTSAGGLTSVNATREYKQNVTDTTFETNLSVNVSKVGYVDNDSVFNLTTSIQYNVTLTLLNTAPTIYLVLPANETNTTDNTTTHTFNFTDPENSTANCTLYYNSTPYGNNSTTSNNTNTNITVNATAGVADGIWDWWVNCTDHADENQSDIWEIWVDAHPPDINWVNDSPDPVYQGQVINISANVTNGGPADIGDVVVDINGTNYSTTQNGEVYYKDDWDTADVIPVQYNYTFYTNDTFGNNATNVSGNFTVIAANASWNVSTLSLDDTSSGNSSTNNASIVSNGTNNETTITEIQDTCSCIAPGPAGPFNLTDATTTEINFTATPTDGLTNNTEYWATYNVSSTQDTVDEQINVSFTFTSWTYWNETSINIGNVIQTQTGAKNASVIAVGNNSDVNVTEVTASNGSSFMSANVTTIGYLADNSNTIVEFNCSPSTDNATGIYETNYTVNSSEYTAGEIIVVSCTVTAGAPSNTAPVVNLESPASNWSNDNTTTHNFNFTDAENLTANCTLYYNDSSGSISNVSTNESTDNDTSTPITPLNEQSEDNYTWWVNCSDGEYENQSAIRWIYIDITIPIVNLMSPTNDTNTTDNTTTHNFNYTDVHSPTANCSLYYNFTNYGNNSSTVNDTSTPITASPEVPDGFYEWWMNCTDLAGNVANSSNRTIAVDATPPTVNWVNDTPDPVVQDNTINITANITAVGPGIIDIVLFDVNGTNYTYTGKVGNVYYYSTWDTDVLAIMYNYTVYANDTFGNDAANVSGNFTVDLAVVDINLTIGTVDFDTMNVGENNDTEDDLPQPFNIENDGNVYVNITVNSTVFFAQSPLDNQTYMFKADNSSEANSFNWSISQITWENMSATQLDVIFELDWNNSNDLAETELNITIPPDEPGGDKSATVTFIASRS